MVLISGSRSRALADKCGESIRDIWVDIPRPPSLREPSQFYVFEPGGIPRKLEEFFHTQDWLATYSENKARIHVFCQPDRAIRDKVGKCAQKLISEVFDIRFKPLAIEWAKNPDE